MHEPRVLAGGVSEPGPRNNSCFAALGGVARRSIYDNMKTAVDRVRKDKSRTVNARFAVMCAHYLYDPEFCNVDMATRPAREPPEGEQNSKGKIHTARRQLS